MRRQISRRADLTALHPAAMARAQTRLVGVEWLRSEAGLVVHAGQGLEGDLWLVDEGEPRRLASAVALGKGYRADFLVAPDGLIVFQGARLLYQSFDPTAACRPLTPEGWRIEAFSLSPNGQLLAVACKDYASSARQSEIHVFLMRDDAPSERWAKSSPNEAIASLAWTPDGQSLAAVSCTTVGRLWRSSRLLIVTARGAREILESETLVGSPAWRADGRELAVLAEMQGASGLVLADPDGRISCRVSFAARGEAFATPLGRGPRLLAWAADHWIVIGSTPAGRELWRVSSEAQPELESLPLPSGINDLGQLTVSPSQRQLAVIASGPSEPPAVWALRLDVPVPHWQKRWSPIEPDEARTEMLPMTGEPIRWPVKESRWAYGMFFRPPGEPPRDGWPLLVLLHDGPIKQAGLGYPEKAPFFLSRSIAVCYVNYRGSAGYGEAYRRAGEGAFGADDTDDVAAALPFLAAVHEVDRQRTAVMGGREGALIALMTMARHPGCFARAIAVFPILDLTSDALRGGLTPAELAVLCGPSCNWAARSPLLQASKMRGEILLIMGGRDPGVAVSGGETLARRLAEQGVGCELKVYPDEGYGWRSAAVIQEYYATIARFLDPLTALEQ